MKRWSRALGLATVLTTAGGIASPVVAQPPEFAKWLKDISAKDAAVRQSALTGFVRCGVDCRAAIPKLAEIYPKAAVSAQGAQRFRQTFKAERPDRVITSVWRETKDAWTPRFPGSERLVMSRRPAARAGSPS